MGGVTYGQLKRKYATDAPASPWHGLPDAELEADRRVAAALGQQSTDRAEAKGGRVIEAWIARELRSRERPRVNRDDALLSHAA
jgi:hypothetical protein